MNVKVIKEIVNNNLLPNDVKRSLIIGVIADDVNAIPDILDILNAERANKKELITDMNLELSKAHIYIDEYTESAKMEKSNFNKGFMLDNISKFYIKYQSKITHCFNRFK
jgi:predicted transcriptional regulator